MTTPTASPSTQHTPGPWHIGRRSGASYIYGPLGEEVAGPSTFTSGHDETLANARLIAAAPDLLAALESAHRALVTCNSCHGIGTLPSESERLEIESATLVARSAIAKARAL